MSLLTGKVALLTGAASGIGRAAALEFAAQGAKLILADISEEEGLATQELVRRAGGVARFACTDVTKAVQVECVVALAMSEFGRLDCAFNNVGIFDNADVADLEEAEWDRVMEVNLKSVWLCMKFELRAMMQGGGGAIVTTASIAGLVGSRFSPAYAASKHGVVGLTKTAALQYAARGVRINAVCPGATRTPMTEKLFVEDASAEEKLMNGYPIRRLGEPIEIAAAAAWLCSSAASFCVGHALAVDGGWVAQ
jgi:NAD(P)-dependent dehydrogenase (short-subunit alcohol dehydrogenase family)